MANKMHVTPGSMMALQARTRIVVVILFLLFGLGLGYAVLQDMPSSGFLVLAHAATGQPLGAATSPNQEAGVQNLVATKIFKRITVANFFSCEVPTDWDLEISESGVSSEGKKVYGVDLRKYTGTPVPLRISVYYYGEGNTLYPTKDFYIAGKSHAVAEQVGAYRYGQVTDSELAGRPALTFMRPYRQFVSPEQFFSDVPKPDAKDDIRVYETGEVMARKIPLIESYVVVPVNGGFYAISYSTPEEFFEEFLNIFNHVAVSLRPAM